MEGLFHLTSYLADDFLNDRLSGKDQSAVTLHLEECQVCRRLILFSITGAEYLLVLLLPPIYLRWTKNCGFIENECKAQDQK